MKKLNIIRRKIDRIDRTILKLLKKRGELVIKTTKFKKLYGENFYSPEREENIIKNLTKLNKGPLSNQAIESIYNEILSACRSLHKKLKICYFDYGYSFLAAIKNFGLNNIEYIQTKNLIELFRKISSGNVDYGIVPEDILKQKKLNLKIIKKINVIVKIFRGTKYYKKFIVLSKN